MAQLAVERLEAAERLTSGRSGYRNPLATRSSDVLARVGSEARPLLFLGGAQLDTVPGVSATLEEPFIIRQDIEGPRAHTKWDLAVEVWPRQPLPACHVHDAERPAVVGEGKSYETWADLVVDETDGESGPCLGIEHSFHFDAETVSDRREPGWALEEGAVLG